MKIYLRVASGILAVVIAITGAWCWVAAKRVEARENELRFFLRGAFAASTVGGTQIHVRALDLPGKPIAACTVWDYDGVEDLHTFLGPQRINDYAASYSMDDKKGGIIVVHDSHLVVVETRSLPFSTAKTACFNSGNLSLVFNGRRLELQAPQ